MHMYMYGASSLRGLSIMGLSRLTDALLSKCMYVCMYMYINNYQWANSLSALSIMGLSRLTNALLSKYK